ncbi:MAG TPA: TIGR03067 domain-containing protein [Gemmataceae bacterium]|nr:TIGR03067 domain-containing protein [Gemmataceae bacterium]
MATPTSFKQQCPSCEAMVPIRDPKLIGRKIDCPKCKYRFVVEEPADEVDEAEEEAAPAQKGKGRATAVTDKKPAAKAAAAKRRPDDDQDVDESKPKKKQGGSGMLIAGIGLAAVAVIALAVGAVFLFTGDDSSDKPTRSSSSTNIAPANADNKVETSPEAPKEEGPRPRQDDISNLLPNDTQIVLNLPLEHLLGNDKANQALLKTPGSFHEGAFQSVWGITPAEIRRVVFAINAEKKTSFSVMRTSAQMKEKEIVEKLKLKPETPINGLKYYVVKKSFDALSTILLKGPVYHEKVALHFMDPFTVVCADMGPMNQFLQDKGQPKQLSKKPTEEDEQQGGGGQGAAPGGPPGGMPGRQPGMPGGPAGGGRGRGSRGAPGGPPSPAPAPPPPPPGGGGPGQRGGGQSGGFRPPQGMMPPAMMPPGMAGGGGASASVTSEAAPFSSSYMTVDPQLKAVLDQVEKVDKTENQHVLLSAAVSSSLVSLEDVKKLMAEAHQQDANVPQVPDVALKLVVDSFKSQVKAVGAAITDFNESRLSGNVAVAAKDASLAQQWEKQLNETIPQVLALTGLEFAARNASNNNRNGMGGMPRTSGMPNMPNMPPGMQGMPGRPNMPNMPGRPNMPNMPGRPNMPPGMGGGSRPGGPPGGMRPPSGGFPGPGMQPPGQGNDTKEEKDQMGDYGIWTKDNVLALGVNYNIPSAIYTQAGKLLEMGAIALRSEAAMSDRQSHIHELAAATQAYLEEKGHFPRGAMLRAPDAQRHLDWRPDQRLSWMTQLLPYLANGEFKSIMPDDNDKDKDKYAWYEGPYVKAGMTVIPQFVMSSHSDNSDYFLTYPNLPVKGTNIWAATHFVGIAGIGLDAAEYRADDPATAKLRGVFGYDIETKKGDIKDGLDQTIVVIQVPPAPKAPWIAGGGSTVRGVSEDLDCVQPFVCTEYQGKRGTFAIMADGKVRFIPATIDPKTFQAMCTIAGGDKIRDLDKVAPEVPPPEEQPQTELKAEQPPPPAAPPPVQQPKSDQDRDLQRLQGTWTLVGGENQARPMPPDMVQQMAVKLVVTGDKFLLTWNENKGDAKQQGGVLKLDETKTPKTFDGQITIGAQTHIGKTMLGIYSLSGDELKWCYSNPGKPRPGRFTTKVGETGVALFVFKRAKP